MFQSGSVVHLGSSKSQSRVVNYEVTPKLQILEPSPSFKDICGYSFILPNWLRVRSKCSHICHEVGIFFDPQTWDDSVRLLGLG